MKTILLAWFVSSAALAQSELPDQNYVANSGGVTLTTQQTISGAKTFSATITSTVASGSDSWTQVQGARLQLGGGPYLYSDGSRVITLAGGYFGGTLEAAGTIFSDTAIACAPTTVGCVMQAGPTDGAGAVTMSIDNTTTLSTAGALMLRGRNNGTVKWSITKDGQFISAVQSLTTADNGNGGTPATDTLNPTSENVLLTCNDAQGCTITMGETGATSGSIVRIVNMSANTANFADTAGVSELVGAYAMGQYDSLTLMYATDRWVELARSNN